MQGQNPLSVRQETAGPEASGRHAVVVGGSIGGMLAARVLADHFDRVTVVERDHLPSGSENRPGVPHARHLHFFLKRGLMVLEELFPGVRADLVEAGCHLLDQGRDFRILYRSGWSPRAELGLEFCTFTRPLLEMIVRRHLAENPRVSFLEGHEVAGLLGDGGEAVRGVRVHRRADGTDASGDRELLAELVMDTSGRGSKAPEWLVALGAEAPEETIVDAFWGYATRIYEPDPSAQNEWKSLFIFNRPPYQPRAGIIQPVEGNRWLVTVAGVMHDFPPTDEEGFLQFARSLSSPALYEAIRNARPLSRVCGYRRTENRLRHYDRAKVPAGFAAMGDAVCGFNPVYGVGMTLTGLEALELAKCLRENGGRLDSRKFQKRVAGLLAGPWALTTGEDLRWPATRGGRITAKVRFMHWYLDQVIQLIPENPDVFRRFQEVNHMLRPPSSLFEAPLLLQVLRRAVLPERAARRRPAVAPQAEAAASVPSSVPARR